MIPLALAAFAALTGLTFTLAICRSAARADALERALQDDSHWLGVGADSFVHDERDTDAAQ
ncbi:hypothetical protein [Sphingomonas soli]|uniref:hypothetical protein n=1 Tax=Sphingomonas soli TaxID=266127 RepID=UPI00082BEF70|nr:hypothetical protein [Sphingomonas soli]